MLLDIRTSIVSSIKVELTFDDNNKKVREIANGDLVAIEFNKNGKRKRIEGKVVKIGASSTIDPKAWYIVVDGSLDYQGQLERFSPQQILDVDIIRKASNNDYISTPNDSSRVTQIRLYDGFLQLSIDGGYSWITPKNTMRVVYHSADDDTIVCRKHCEDHYMNKKPVYVEGDGSEEEFDQEENTTPSA